MNTAPAQEREDVLMYAIDKIVAVDRHRVALGDIEQLAASIKEVGLLHPIVITPSGRLVAGFRRLEACRRLGRKRVPVTIATSLTDARALLVAERDENTCRLDMTPSEKVSLGRALEELERPKAAKRKADAGKANLPNASGEKFTPLAGAGKTTDIVGAAVGMSRPTYERAKLVVEACEDETLPPRVREIAQEARDEMDRTGKVLPAHDKVAPLIGKKPARGGVTRDGSGTRSDRGAPYEPVTERQRQLADAQRQRMVKALSGISGFCRALEDVDLRMAVSVMSADERLTWIEQARDAARALKKFAHTLSDED